MGKGQPKAPAGLPEPEPIRPGFDGLEFSNDYHGLAL
jgi:hypothetical protein